MARPAKKKKKKKAYGRYRWREKHKKQYTFTKTKFIVGFLISVLTSVFLGSYFDHYGGIVLRQTMAAAKTAWQDEAVEAQSEAVPEQELSNLNSLPKSSEVNIEELELKVLPRKKGRLFSFEPADGEK